MSLILETRANRVTIAGLLAMATAMLLATGCSDARDGASANEGADEPAATDESAATARCAVPAPTCSPQREFRKYVTKTKDGFCPDIAAAGLTGKWTNIRNGHYTDQSSDIVETRDLYFPAPYCFYRWTGDVARLQQASRALCTKRITVAVAACRDRPAAGGKHLRARNNSCDTCIRNADLDEIEPSEL